MKKTAVFLFLLLCFPVFIIKGQTGPAGVGSSSNNPLWLKADAGTSTTADNTPLSSWNDQSGNGINVSQISATQQPLFRTSVMNGFPAIEFDNGNTPGQNDFLIAPDNSLLDNTNGYTFFTVTRMKTLDGDARCIVSKRTAIDQDEAFMLFYYTGNNFFTDLDGLGDRFSTPAPAYAVNTNYLHSVVYDGTLTASNRAKVYDSEFLKVTAAESSPVIGNKASPLLLGATHSSDNRPFSGYISEVIIYTTALNDASRIIVNNYLSAKYNIALNSNDKYAGDDPANGNYDREVAGIGKEASGMNTAFAASATGGLSMSMVSGLDNGDYVLVGHASPSNSQLTTDVGGMTGTGNARWERIWYIDVANTASNIVVDVEFDLSDGGMAPLVPGNVADYLLLYRPGQTGNWTELATANSTPGDRIKFNSYSFTNDGYYTVGTKNMTSSPLPIELLGFNAKCSENEVKLEWATATETNNDFFTVERTRDGSSFEAAAIVKGAGNSNSVKEYSAVDKLAWDGTYYYRLKQTDFDGSATYSELISINCSSDEKPLLFPNPATERLNIVIPVDEVCYVQIINPMGQAVYSAQLESNGQIDLSSSERGIYFVKFTYPSFGRSYSEKLVKQ